MFFWLFVAIPPICRIHKHENRWRPTFHMSKYIKAMNFYNVKTKPSSWPGSHSQPEDASWPDQPLCSWVVTWSTGGREGWQVGWPRYLGQSLGPLKPWMRLILSCSTGSRSRWSLLATHQPRFFPLLPTPSPSPCSFSGFWDSAMGLPKPPHQNIG